MFRVLGMYNFEKVANFVSVDFFQLFFVSWLRSTISFILLFLSHYLFMAVDLSLFSLVRVGPRYMQSRWKKVYNYTYLDKIAHYKLMNQTLSHK